MDYIKVNDTKKIVYVALGRTTGLTDLQLQVYNDAGVAVGSPTIFTELANGAYSVNFTPNSIGVWRVRVFSPINGDDAIRSYEVINTKIDDIKITIDSVEAKVDAVDVKIDAVDAKVTTLDIKADAIKTETDKIQTIDDNIDAIKTKTDNLPVNTAQELTDIDNSLTGIQSDVTVIKNNVTAGGYFA